MDCPGQTNHQRQETSDGRQAQRGGQTAELHPQLFLVGELADAADCSIYAVQHFLKKYKIRHTCRVGNYRQFNRDVLKQLRDYRDELDKRKSEIAFEKKRKMA